LIKSTKDPPIPGSSTPFEFERVVKNLVKCSELKTDISGINYSENDLKDSFCIEFDQKTEIGGSFKDGLYRRFQLILAHCVPSLTNNCMATPTSGPAVLTTNNLAVQSEFLTEFSLEVSYTEDYPGLQDLKKPIIRNLVSYSSIKFRSNNSAMSTIVFS
jgi:hypothetical protein